MTSDRKKPGAAFWATVAIVVALVAYPLSFGPACWWFSTTRPEEQMAPGLVTHRVPMAYWPLGWVAKKAGWRAERCLGWFGRLGLPQGTAIAVPISPDSRDWI